MCLIGEMNVLPQIFDGTPLQGFKSNALLEPTKVDLALDIFADQASHPTLTFLGRPLRNFPMRRDAATSKRFRCFNQTLPVPGLTFSAS